MTEIVCPTIDLFLYDLRNSLDDNEDNIEQNRKYFRSKIDTSVHEQLKKDDDNELEIEYYYLLDKPYAAPLKPNTKLEDGYYYPVRLGDTYGLLLEYPSPHKNASQPVKSFGDLKAKIHQDLSGKVATLGQTWMISSYLPDGNNTNSEHIEKIAKDIYKSTMSDVDWDEEFDGQGKFLGATIFEISPSQLQKQKVNITPEKEVEIIRQNNHVLIAIYQDKESFEQLGKFYVYWMRLLCYHHKIIWAYGQSRIANQLLKKEFSLINSGISSIEQNLSKKNELDKLQNILIEIQNKLNTYVSNLNKLNFQAQTIDINLENYQKCLEAIKKKSKKINPQMETELKFLENFVQKVSNKYSLQIQKDSESLQLGLKLLEDMSNAVRNRVEIEKAKQDKYFQDTIAIVGIGWATANIVTKHIPFGKITKETEIKGKVEIIDPLQIRMIIPGTAFDNNVAPLIYSLGIAFIVIILFLILKSRFSFLSKFLEK